MDIVCVSQRKKASLRQHALDALRYVCAGALAYVSAFLSWSLSLITGSGFSVDNLFVLEQKQPLTFGAK